MNVQYAIQRDTVYVLEVIRARRERFVCEQATGCRSRKSPRGSWLQEAERYEAPVGSPRRRREIAVHDFYSVKSPRLPVQ